MITAADRLHRGLRMRMRIRMRGRAAHPRSIAAAPNRCGRPPLPLDQSLLAARTLGLAPWIADHAAVRAFAAASKRTDAPPRRRAETHQHQPRDPPPTPTRAPSPFKRPAASQLRRLALVGAFLGLNVLGAQVHRDDASFNYLYPFPFAIDVASGPSMRPTMRTGEVYWRDCWSHRLVWLDLGHWGALLRSLAPSTSPKRPGEAADAATGMSLKRPWQKGDVVTIYNPFTESIVTKRIVGVAGDSVRLFGEHSPRYRDAAVASALPDKTVGDGARSLDCGVPNDARFPAPYCERMRAARAPRARPEDVVVVVPPGHVWVEGDDPPASTDSRHYGPVRESSLRGRIVARLWPARRDGDGATAVLDARRPTPAVGGAREGDNA